MKKAFTLLELMVVMAILGVLLGIVMTAASNSFRHTRQKKSEFLCALVRQGLETFYEQEGEWPVSIPAGSMNSSYELSSSQVRDSVKDLVKKTKDGSPVFDVSGLYVSSNPGEAGSRAHGQDFWQAVRGTPQNPRGLGLSRMYFGYPETDHGYFRRFRIVYHYATDSMEVKRQ